MSPSESSLKMNKQTSVLDKETAYGQKFTLNKKNKGSIVGW